MGTRGEAPPDSVMLGARSELERDIPGARVDAGVSRQFWDAVPILEAARRNGSLPRTVVIHLGTNGAFAEDVIPRIMDAVGAESNVYFLTAKVPRPWEQAVNSQLVHQIPGVANAHLLDWHGYADGKPWFASDGFHLVGDGPEQYAQFIRDRIRPEPTTYADPFAGVAVPSTGLYVTDDPKWSKDRGATSFAITLFDEDGTDRGALPRATIDDTVLNTTRHTLVVADDGIRIANTPFETGVGLPDGCTQTEHASTFEVALCGRSGGPGLLLGDRILANAGSGWRQLISKPPGAVVGHWIWASPSPDGQWVLASWSAECEVVTSVFIRVADGAVHAVTGEPGIAAPESGDLGWTATGDALAVFGSADTGCGTSAVRPRGVYLVSPTEGIRRMLLPLGPTAGVFRWSSVDDRRTREQVPVSVDLDGDGRVDRLSITAPTIGSGPVEMRATLADGRVVTGTYPSAYSVHVVATVDLAGDGRHEVITTLGGETWTVGGIVVLEGDRLVVIDQTPGGAPIGWAAHSNGNPYGTADVACRTVAGEPALVTSRSTVERDGRHWQRWVSTLEGARLVYRTSDSGVIGPASPAPPGVPLANRIECG